MTLAKSISVTSPISLPKFLNGGGAAGETLRGIDWSSHALGAPDTWPTMLKSMTNLVLRARQPMFVMWGPEYHLIYNDGYAEICGDRHPAAQGAKLLDVWWDIRPVVESMALQVYAGESLFIDDLEVQLSRNGKIEEAHFSFSHTPLQLDDGTIAGMFCACTETTREIMLGRDLAHERRQLGQMFEEAPSFIAIVKGPDHVFELANPAYMRLVGHRDIIGKSVVEAMPELRTQPYIAMLDSVIASTKAVRIDGAKVALQRMPNGPTEDRFVDFVYQPMLNAAGEVTGIFADGVDVTDRTLALTALQTSEQFLQSVLGASSDCIKVLNLDGRLIYMSAGGRHVMEVPADQQIEGNFWPEFWGGPGNADAMSAFEQAKTGVAANFQGFADTFSGNPRYWDVRVTPMLDSFGNTDRILAVSRDISYLKRIEEEREHLTHELSHRLKNAFSMVQSVIGQTLRHAKSLQEGREILSGRVRALSDAQDILTRSIVGEMQIDAVVQAALLPHRTGDGRFSVSGPAATISGRQGLGLSLALHELCTNATKYGALSTSDGHVQIIWDVQPGGCFIFDWRETGGPPVSAPDRSGFGSVLIEKVVATYFDGSATLDFEPSGVVFRLTGTISVPEIPTDTDPY